MFKILSIALALNSVEAISFEQVDSYQPVGATQDSLKQLKDQLGQSYFLLISTWKLPMINSYKQMYGQVGGSQQVITLLS
jgi:hypothetical protein